MSYGTGNYGQSGYGSSFTDGAPSLVSSVPVNGAVNIPSSTLLEFTLSANAGLDEYSLNATLETAQAIVGGVFQPGYTGTLTFTETTLVVVFTSQPDMSVGPTTLHLEVSDLAGTAGTFDVTFDVDSTLAGAETVTLSESLYVGQTSSLSVSEAYTLTELIQTGSFDARALDGHTIFVSFPEEYRFDGISNFDNFGLRPLAGATPVRILSIEPLFDVIQSGSSARLVDDQSADGTSGVLEVTGTINPDREGDYVQLLSSRNVGRYRINTVLTPMADPLGALLPRVRLDKRLFLTDPTNGIVQGQGTVTGANLRLDGLTPGDPILSLVRIENRTTGVTKDDAYIRANPTFYTVVDYRTVSINPSLMTIGANDRVILTVAITAKTQWQHTSAVKALLLHTTKLTGGVSYLFTARHLRTKITNAEKSLEVVVNTTYPTVEKPRAISATFLPADGTVVVRYDQPMRMDDLNLANAGDYVITGPSTVTLRRVTMLDDTTVALETTGLGEGDYTLTISTSTPKDEAGNPLDPTYNTLVFTAAVPQEHRSVFTDKGPIAKPPLELQAGTGGTINTYNEVTLPGSSLVSNLVGQMVRLSGSSINGGTFRISSVVSSTRARLANASFTLPDATSLTWSIFDPRDGQIADDPSDVTVRVNGTEVVPEAVVGLLGQVLLPSTPSESDSVEIDYSWVLNPVVEVRRLNSKEFHLNAWNRDHGRTSLQHKYRFNNVLISPSDYEADDLRAKLDQPEQRELHYRAFERAYTPTLNDPSLLLLNSPTHQIAYPPSQRTLSEENVSYEATVLPEDSTPSWTRKGTGTASVLLGQLTLQDTAGGDYPAGQPIMWTRTLDLTFPHVFAMSWRFRISATTQLDGVFTGLAVGYSDDLRAFVVGFVLDGGVAKIGVLKKGAADDPSLLTAWTGGIDVTDNPTNAPATVDWSTLHSFRIFRDQNGTVKLYVDGDVIETLRVTEDELPFLEEVGAPFDGVQGAFFGSISRPARSTSVWDFVRYVTLPTNPLQAVPSRFVDYEAAVLPEADVVPWAPVGYHGTGTILSSDTLLLDSTSASTPTSDVGLVGGDFRGYLRMEPLLTAASECVYEAEVRLRTNTQGVAPHSLTMAVDDGDRLIQLSFLADRAVPKFSYGGRSLPEDFGPTTWDIMGTASAAMVGRLLRITDTMSGDGRVYFTEDTAPIGTDARVVGSSTDYIVEARFRVVSFTVDGSGFAGAFFQAYDSGRSVGLMIQVVSGVKYVALHSDGASLGGSARFAFNWGDGKAHTYRISKSTGGDLVSVFVDGVFLGSFPYSSFQAPAADPVGMVSFGSSTPASAAALSVIEWSYANAWRVRSDLKRYVGLWKGTDDNSLLGYHLPKKASGREATIAGNALGDSAADFITANVVTGDLLVVDAGPNRGVYTVAGVGSAQALTIVGVWPTQPSVVDYRIVKETDWTTLHKYRIAKDATGEVAVLLDTDPQPLILVGYNSLDLPASGTGLVRTLSTGLPAFVFGSFDSENLAQSSWEYVRYGLTRSVTELRAAPHHQVLNQWNMMHSPERLFSNLAHTLTSFKSSSTGIVPKTDPDFFENSGLTAWTILNQGTPLVPSTQTIQVRSPFPTQTFTSALNRPEDVLNSDGDFSLNDASMRYELIIPKDILYSSLDVIEQTTGEVDLLTPFDDQEGFPVFQGVQYQKEVCLTYDGSVLPQNDATAPTPWTLASDTPSQVNTSAFAGLLTYGTGMTGTKTIYRNDTPLPDHPSLQTQARFRIRIVNDSTGGTGDTQIKLGLSAPGMTVALAFVTTPTGERLVVVKDLNNGATLGATTFDFLDGAQHTYRIVRDPGSAQVRVFVDS